MINPTNWKRSLKNTDEYASSWDWARDHSEYHFNNQNRDRLGEWFDILGRFVGDWNQDLEQISARSSPITWATRKFYTDEQTVSDMLPQEEYDLVKSGAPVDLQLTDAVFDISSCPTIIRMSEYFALEDVSIRVHNQMPGQMFNYHIDKLWDRCQDNPERVVRLTVMLTDWSPGQFYIYGTYHYSHWQAGDVHIFDWPNIPHATANASHYPRPTLQITGLKTDRSREIFDAASVDSRYYV